MRTVMEGLGSALKGNMTQHVISQSKMEGNDMIYYDDFLGDGDIDNNKKHVVSLSCNNWLVVLLHHANFTKKLQRS